MRMIGQTQETAERGIFVKETTVVKNNKMLPVARRLRREMTLSEQHLWFRFLRSYPVKIYKQRIIESFVVDFYCAEARSKPRLCAASAGLALSVIAYAMPPLPK